MAIVGIFGLAALTKERIGLIKEENPILVLGLIKDLESKTDLMPTITATEDGATQMTFTVTDNDDSKDLDATDGVIRDPAGISMAFAALVPPSVPVPLMGQFFLFLLGGLVSLIGGLRSLRRRAT